MIAYSMFAKVLWVCGAKCSDVVTKTKQTEESILLLSIFLGGLLPKSETSSKYPDWTIMTSPRIDIEYCGGWGYGPRFRELEAVIKVKKS